MAENTVRLISQSLRTWHQYLDRLESEPTGRTQAGLNAILSTAFATTQINVHVRAASPSDPIPGGRLRASGYPSNSLRRTSRRNQWSGEISYGEGLDYAKYEMGERRKGVRPDWVVHPSHDPYEGLEVYHAEIDALLDGLFI